MNNLNLFGKEWLNIVFENRNKLYGAYKLRKESNKTTFMALAIGLGLISLGFGSSYLYASKSEGTVIIVNLPDEETPTVTPKDIDTPPEKPKDIPKDIIEPATQKETTASARTSVQKEIEFKTMRVEKDHKVVNENLAAQSDFTDEIQSGQKNNDADLENGVLKSNGGITGDAKDGIDGKKPGDDVGTTTTDLTNNIVRLVQHKAMPNEGYDKFFESFIRKFSKNSIESNEKELVIKLRFVVEKDGSFTDIQIIEDKFGLGNEAVRVLKSMPKWKPAQHNGTSVRSIFTLPIKVRVNN